MARTIRPGRDGDHVEKQKIVAPMTYQHSKSKQEALKILNEAKILTQTKIYTGGIKHNK